MPDCSHATPIAWTNRCICRPADGLRRGSGAVPGRRRGLGHHGARISRRQSWRPAVDGAQHLGRGAEQDPVGLAAVAGQPLLLSQPARLRVQPDGPRGRQPEGRGRDGPDQPPGLAGDDVDDDADAGRRRRPRRSAALAGLWTGAQAQRSLAADRPGPGADADRRLRQRACDARQCGRCRREPDRAASGLLFPRPCQSRPRKLRAGRQGFRCRARGPDGAQEPPRRRAVALRRPGARPAGRARVC